VRASPTMLSFLKEKYYAVNEIRARTLGELLAVLNDRRPVAAAVAAAAVVAAASCSSMTCC
jgi:hypothetical protein